MSAKTKVKKRFLQLLAVVVAVVVIVGGIQLYAIIQHANMVKLSVDKSVFKPGFNLPLKKGTEYRFVVTTISIKNNSSDPITIDPATQIVLTDKTGAQYGPQTMQVDNPLKAGPVAGGETKTGQLSFIVGNDAKDFKVHLDLKSVDLKLSADAAPSL